MGRLHGLCRVCVQSFPLRVDRSVGWHRDGDTACEGSRLLEMNAPKYPDHARDYSIVYSAPWLTDGVRRRRLRAIVADAEFSGRGIPRLYVYAHYETPAGSLLAHMPADDWFRWATVAWTEGARS